MREIEIVGHLLKLQSHKKYLPKQLCQQVVIVIVGELGSATRENG